MLRVAAYIVEPMRRWAGVESCRYLRRPSGAIGTGPERRVSVPGASETVGNSSEHGGESRRE